MDTIKQLITALGAVVSTGITAKIVWNLIQAKVSADEYEKKSIYRKIKNTLIALAVSLSLTTSSPLINLIKTYFS